MKKILLLTLLLTSCTVYTEKQSEVVSQSVYATKDSIDAARIDLANSYINEATRIIKPPKNRIGISSVYNVTESKTTTLTTDDGKKQRVVIVPEQYKNDKVIVVNTADYSDLLKNKDIAKQLEKDYKNVVSTKEKTDKELEKQIENTNKMVKDLNILQQKVLKQRITIIWEGITIVGLLALIAGYIYMRMNSGFRLF